MTLHTHNLITLYELSLAVGGSIETQKNCEEFVKALVTQKGYSFVSIWARNIPSVEFKEERCSEKKFDLLFAYPAAKVRDIKLTNINHICHQLQTKNFFSVSSSSHSEDFNAYIHEKEVKSGTYSFFRLGNFGFLKAYTANRQKPYDSTELSQLQNVMNKFAVSVEGCFAYERERFNKMKLVEKESKLRQVIDTSLDAVVIIDEKEKIIEWSRQAETIFGYTKGEVFGKRVVDFIIAPTYRQYYQRAADQFVKNETNTYFDKFLELTALRKNQVEFPIEMTVSHIKINGKDSFSMFFRDITNRKKDENELIRAKHEAEKARLAERQFLANMSHEIRTPMNAVIGMSHLLYQSNLTEVQKDYVDSLMFSADSLMAIINNILDLSKIEAGELEFESSSFNLFELLKSLQSSFQYKVKEKPISVAFSLDYKIENQIIGDPTRLNQILINLLGNSAKFTPQGSIGIDVRLLEETHDTYLIQFNVHDTGIGIPLEKLPLIFKSFKQVDNQVTRKYGGTGLGLSIVKELVERQGGNIEVKSKEGEGTEFCFRLLFGKDGKKGLRNLKTELKMETSFSLEKVRVLVVEDNDMNQKLITKILKIWNANFDLAVNGLEAVEMAKKSAYQLILMDIHMPEMDGCAATLEIRKNPENPNIKTPIIALTAAALLDEKRRVFDAGMDDFLTKPFSPKMLQGIFEKWLDLSFIQQINGVESIAEDTNKSIKDTFRYLYEFSDGDLDFIQDMLETFLEQTPKQMDELSDACEDLNHEKVYKIAHRIKPSFMMIGLTELEELAQTVEQMAKASTFEREKVSDYILIMKKEVFNYLPELKQKLTLFTK
ncbi:MAG: ATP-binding protein [Chitinophagales bacterium]